MSKDVLLIFINAFNILPHHSSTLIRKVKHFFEHELNPFGMYFQSRPGSGSSTVFLLNILEFGKKQ